MRTPIRYLTNVSAVSLGLALLSCEAVFTTSSEPAGNPPTNTLGSYYFLPKSRIKIDGVPGKDTGTYSITITPVNEPDRNHRYFLRYHPNALAEDTYTITVDAKGLLQTLNLQAEDKTPAIINKVADTAASILSAAENAAAMVRLQGTPPPKPCDSPPQLPFTVVFDPQDENEYSKARRLVSAAHFILDVSPVPSARRKTSSFTADGNKQVLVDARGVSSSELQTLSSDGVFFHPPTIVTVEVRPEDSTCLRLVYVTDIRIPDKHQLAVFDLRRMALVKRTTNLAFVDGNLTTVGETRPSQALAAVTIPADLAAKAAAAIPALIKIQNDTANASVNAETARLNAQTARLNAESNWLKAEANLAQQRGGNADSTSSASRAMLQHAEAENNRAKAELIKTQAQFETKVAATPSASVTATPTPSPTRQE
jgi:hypothetical protein